jgi:hypothetical protein
MREPSSFSIDRRIPLALLFTLLVQAATAVWWVSAKEAQDGGRDGRLRQIEQRQTDDRKYQMDVIERLARLEAHAENQRALLQQIATQLAKK